MKLMALMLALAQEPANKTEAGEVSTVPTIHCVGIEWLITGDANHNGTCKVEYRKKGAAEWKRGMDLLRCDNDRHNGFIGSLFFLEPATEYEIKLEIADPDGGAKTSTVSETTRAVPALPAGGRTLHVVPGAGGGDGSEGAPFQGLKAAQASAKAGDLFLLRPGKYGAFTFDKGGEAGRPVCWKGSGEVELGAAVPAASHLWFEGLTFKPENKDQEDGFKAERSVQNVVVVRCKFLGFHHTMKLGQGNARWYIADNVMEGNNDAVDGGLTGEGIELGKTSGNIVCYNRIVRSADGVSYPGSDNDIYGNDIQDVSDDAVETDMGQRNNRVWGNRITNPCNSVFSWQPMNRGPWYFIRNQVTMTRGKPLKFVQVPDRFALIHNTFIFPGRASEYAQSLLNSYCRNNLWIVTGPPHPSKPGLFRAAYNPKKPDRPGGSFTPFWASDLDYDGFDWDTMADPFDWNGKVYADIGSLSAALGIWKNAVRVKKDEIFESWAMPSSVVGAAPATYTLKAGCGAVDKGAVVPNVSDGFTGGAPDLGCHEQGLPLTQYGPRP